MKIPSCFSMRKQCWEGSGCLVAAQIEAMSIFNVYLWQPLGNRQLIYNEDGPSKGKKTHTLWKHPTSLLYSPILWILPWHLQQWRHQRTPRAILLKGPLKRFLTSWPWPMTLTYKLDLDILPLDPNAKNQDCLFVRSSARVVTDTHTDTHRHTDDVKTITPITSETWGVKTDKWLVETNLVVYLLFYFVLLHLHGDEIYRSFLLAEILSPQTHSHSRLEEPFHILKKSNNAFRNTNL